MEKEKEMKGAYVERDLSWMYFNHRILQEAEKKDVPILERMSFLGIYSIKSIVVSINLISLIFGCKGTGIWLQQGNKKIKTSIR